MGPTSYLQELLEELAFIESSNRKAPGNVHELAARLSVVKREMEELDRAVEEQKRTIVIFEKEKALLDGRLAYDTLLGEQELKKRDDWSLGQLGSLGKARIKDLGENYEAARKNISKWRKTQQASDSKRLRHLLPLLISHHEKLSELQRDYERWAEEGRDLEGRIERYESSPLEQELRTKITTYLDEIEALAVSCLDVRQIPDFRSWFRREVTASAADYSGEGAAANWKKTKLSSTRFKELYDDTGQLTANFDAKVLLEAFLLFWNLKHSL